MTQDFSKNLDLIQANCLLPSFSCSSCILLFNLVPDLSFPDLTFETFSILLELTEGFHCISPNLVWKSIQMSHVLKSHELVDLLNIYLWYPIRNLAHHWIRDHWLKLLGNKIPLHHDGSIKTIVIWRFEGIHLVFFDLPL